MTDKDHPPVGRDSSPLRTHAKFGVRGVLERIWSGLLAIVRAKRVSSEQARFKIGAYELCEPDYWQIIQWAEALGDSPEVVLKVLEGTRFSSVRDGLTIDFTVVEGCISSLVWDFAKLPLDAIPWRDDLSIRALVYQSDLPSIFLPRTFPAGLRTLVCNGLRLGELDLSKVPRLAELYCRSNEVAALDLSPVPGLKRLDCGLNRLTRLDLSPVSRLTALNCRENQLTQLDLSRVPRLTTLDCCENQLT